MWSSFSVTNKEETRSILLSQSASIASSAGIAFRLSGKISCRQKNFLKYVNYEMPAEEACASILSLYFSGSCIPISFPEPAILGKEREALG
jgi:hypothetical protein